MLTKYLSGSKRTPENDNPTIIGQIKLITFALTILMLAAQALFAQNDISRSMLGTQPDTRSEKSVKNDNVINAPSAPATASFTEGFDSGALPADWSIQNLSSPVGTNTNCWNLFTTTPWAPQAGTGHIGANLTARRAQIPSAAGFSAVRYNLRTAIRSNFGRGKVLPTASPTI